MTRTYVGSCHCGAVRYEADIDLAQGAGKCNCTFCTKARAWKTFVQPSSFRLLSGSDTTKGYHKHPQAPMKYFCTECGVYTHELGSADYMGGDFVGIFLASLDDADQRTCSRRQYAIRMDATTTGRIRRRRRAIFD